MKNKIKVLTITALITSFIGSSTSFAYDNSVDKMQIKNILQNVKIGKNITDSEKEMLKYFKGGKFEHKFDRLYKIGSHLTDSEKITLSSMSDDEKKVFFAKKREEKRLLNESYRKIIDKLLIGESLTSEEEKLKSEIIEKRLEKQKNKEEIKRKRLENKVKNQKIKEIFKKYKNKEVLTTEEQKVVEDIKAKRKMYRGEHKKHK